MGSQRSLAQPGELAYFEDIQAYRYGYETPFIPSWIGSLQPEGKRVLEIGVGNGVDAVYLAGLGARYVGLDVTERHLELSRRHFELRGFRPEALVHGDLLEQPLEGCFDLIYSFGVLHHIHHEEEYLRRSRELLAPRGRLAVALYAKMSVFNAYMLATWILRNRLRVGLDAWRSHLSELTPLDQPVVIKIRSRRAIQVLLERVGFQVIEYKKRGFVQGNLPGLGRLLAPGGRTLTLLSSMLGWYHLFVCEAAERG